MKRQASVPLLALVLAAAGVVTASAETPAVSAGRSSVSSSAPRVSTTTTATTSSSARAPPTAVTSREAATSPSTRRRDETAAAVDLPHTGLASCGEERVNDGNCFVFSTIFPRDGDVPEDACALRSPPEVTLDGVALELISHAFDGKDLYFEVDMPSALVNAGVVPGSTPTLRATTSLACPKDVFDASVAMAGGDASGLGGRVTWIFPFNFYLLEEIVFLGDSIESLVEAADNLQVTVNGDQEAEEFLYGDGWAYRLNTRDEDDDDDAPPVDTFPPVFDPFPPVFDFDFQEILQGTM